MEIIVSNPKVSEREYIKKIEKLAENFWRSEEQTRRMPRPNMYCPPDWPSHRKVTVDVFTKNIFKKDEIELILDLVKQRNKFILYVHESEMRFYPIFCLVWNMNPPMAGWKGSQTRKYLIKFKEEHLPNEYKEEELKKLLDVLYGSENLQKLSAYDYKLPERESFFNKFYY
ncbi:MAG: hypothetical protein US50_C0064G0009 [Candidatus Nomurabacteria bacterium GW2011_GWB1_37_5]|uniref:Uncharacterized protein n=1 Tax=Candidatus Nomurabacteria bacterium GW2011_GWB1_37_5 TaxID=1618742 RepID=A0A0G0GVD6_9BACT|nr:MAG: hypothetical protein US50_C0064G0009 [Candidatus Nomurabacteria bacterium GW2011_GWB1_37_5]